DALEIAQFDLRFCLLLQRSEDQEKVPHAHSDLHAIGIMLAVVRAVYHLDVGRSWVRHKKTQCSANEAGTSEAAKLCSPGDLQSWSLFTTSEILLDLENTFRHPKQKSKHG